METPVETAEASFDVIESISKHIAQLKPLMAERALICIGDYPAKIKIILKEPFVEETRGILPIFIQKSSDEILKLTQSISVPHEILSVDTDVDTHFWFNVNSYLAKDEKYAARLRDITAKFHDTIILVSVSEGLGSALLPTLTSQFRASNANSVALAILPSKKQPADAHFNALASIGMCASNDSAAVVLFDRDSVEDYVGVDRNGSRMKGNRVISYMLEMMLAKETLTQELSELSRTFGVKFYTAMSVMGASFKVYGSFESMLDAAALNPFLPFDLASASVLYVLVRVPLSLRDRLSRGKIELATAKWSKIIANVKSIYVSEPIYVNDATDRIDVVVFAGGFDVTELMAFLQKKAAKIKSETVKKGLLKEKDWQTIVGSLPASA
jgi:hypothetical protein